MVEIRKKKKKKNGEGGGREKESEWRRIESVTFRGANLEAAEDRSSPPPCLGGEEEEEEGRGVVSGGAEAPQPVLCGSRGGGVGGLCVVSLCPAVSAKLTVCVCVSVSLHTGGLHS